MLLCVSVVCSFLLLSPLDEWTNWSTYGWASMHLGPRTLWHLILGEADGSLFRIMQENNNNKSIRTPSDIAIVIKGLHLNIRSNLSIIQWWL